MESLSNFRSLGRANEDLGKREYSETTNTSIQETEKIKRVRNSQGRRDYICGCSKAYLSYAAIYTHARIKHDGNYPKKTIINKEGMPQRQFNILGKSNKHAVNVTGTINPSKTLKSTLPTISGIRQFLKSVKLNYQAPEVNRASNSETVF